METESNTLKTLGSSEPTTKKFASLNGYTLIKCLGAGFHAKVKLGLNPQNGQKVAIKIFKKIHKDESNLKTLKHEIGIMQKLKHVNLVNLIDVLQEATYKQKNGVTYKCFAIVLEYVAGGELFQFVSNTGRFRETVARAYFLQMIAGLAHIHEKGIAHRDMKPENILFSEEFILKIADFGFSAGLEGKDGSGFLRTVLGTESYMAPEINAKTPYSGAAVDLFAAGVILFIIFSGGPPFTKADGKDPYYKLLCNNKHETFWAAHSRGKPTGFFSPEFKDLINRMLAADPTQRLSISQIVNHPWSLKEKESSQKLFEEFRKRKDIVDKELEKARLAQLAEKEKQNQKTGANLLYTGAPGFRSGEEQTQKDVEFTSIFKNFSNSRVCNVIKGSKRNICSVADAKYVFEYLLDQRNNFCGNLELDEQFYKLKCTQLYEDELLEISEDIAFEIEILLDSEDPDLVHIDVQRLEGSAIEFENSHAAIRDIIQKLLPESEAPVVSF